MSKFSVVPPPRPDKGARLFTRLEGDAMGQMIASMIAQQLGDLHQMREDIARPCRHYTNLPHDVRDRVEYDARLVVNLQRADLRSAAIWKAAEGMAQVYTTRPFRQLSLAAQNRFYQLALAAVTTYTTILDGSSAVTLKDYAAAAVAEAKGEQ